MSDEDDTTTSTGSDNHGLTTVSTVEEMQREGLLLAGFSEETQARQPKSNKGDFKDRYGSCALVLVCIWEDLQTSSYERARVPPEKLNLKYYLMAHHFLKQYPTESERKCTYQMRTQTQRDWVWCCVEKIRALLQQKTCIPQDHIDGDDIWVLTVDGTMSSAWEKAAEEEDVVKDPKQFSFKHHSAGFNAEVGISVKESRCVWISTGPAGSAGDRPQFRKEGGLRDKLREIKKKGIADGGHTGDPDELSTPNGHDSAAVSALCKRLRLDS